MLKAFAATTLIGLGESMPYEQTPESATVACDGALIADVNEIKVPGGEKNDSEPSGVFKHLMHAYEKSISMADAAKADVQSTVADAESLRTNAGLYTPK